MKQLPTAEELMTKVANEHSYETWGEMMYDTHEHSQKLPTAFEFFERFYDNPENLSPEEILQKMRTLGHGPNRDKRFTELCLYGDVQITKEQWITKYTTK